MVDNFFIFLFTSDWFLGRKDFTPLPRSAKEETWTENQRKTVLDADFLFGNNEWRNYLLNEKSVDDKMKILVELYTSQLHKWFRYILALPFTPKPKQIYHLILSSNYEAGVRATRNFYAQIMGNPKYSPDINTAYKEFKKLHPDILIGLGGNRRPVQWHLLRRTITDHEEGICDYGCSDFADIDNNPNNIQLLLDWLEENGYLSRFGIDNAWRLPIQQYEFNWSTIKERLGVDPPLPLEPLSSKEIAE